ncbi:MAG: ATP-dependent DNA ligase, partial [Micrococcales bacterium]|nr:ATP-dependent DNA ligase [Micrococcales bacterium]
MRFADLVAVSTQVGATRSRTAKIQLVAEALRAAEPAGVRLVASYLAGTLPQRRTGVGWRSLMNRPASAADPSLSLAQVDAAISEIAALGGPGSAAQRTQAVGRLFGALTGPEQDFLAGLLTGEIRQGALDGLLLSAIAKASDVPDADVRRAVMLAGRSAEVAPIALAQGAEGLARIGLEVGRPLRPMLAGSAPDVDAALVQVGAGAPVAVERKLDGIRLQAHKDGAEVRLFTRSLDDITARLPEVVALVAAVPARCLVLDAEAIALRPDGRPHPFQVTGARTASRTDPVTLAGQTPVTTFVFDALHLDGRDLLDEPAAVRVEAIAELMPDAIVPRLVTADAAQARAFFDAQVAAGHEGVVV